MKPLFDFDGNGKTDALELLLATGGIDDLQSDNNFDEDELEDNDSEDDSDYLFDDDEDE